MQDTIGVGTLAIAGIVAIITGLQAWTYRLQLRHELFERRYAVFKTAQRYLSKIAEDGSLSDEVRAQLYPEMVDAWQRSRFLFGKDVSEYLDRIRQRSLKLSLLAHQKKHEEVRNELKWLLDQLPELFERFRPYLQFTLK